MRSAPIVCLVVLGLATPALAADPAGDPPLLRGTVRYVPGEPVYYPWRGFYFGGSFGYSTAKADFAHGTSDLVAYLLQNTFVENEFQVSSWAALRSASARGTNFGGFVGYNMQWEDAVIGIEANYYKTDLQASASATISRTVVTSDNYRNFVTVTSQSAVKITDIGTARVRAGWVVNWLMPYATIGLAVARANLARSAVVDYSAVDSRLPAILPPIGPLTLAVADDKNGSYSFGLALGLGADLALTPNFFLRAEYEYMRFPNIAGTNVNMNTVRAGAGVKF